MQLADATMEDEARVPRRPHADEVSIDPDLGPKTKPNRRLGIALLLFVLGYSTAAVTFGWWPL